MSNVFITGANRGIGLEMARQHAMRGDRVSVCCRHSSPELDALGVEVFEGVDVTDQAALANMAENLSGRRIDRLINNAGILERDTVDQVDFSSMERQFQVNSLGPLKTSLALRSNLQPGSMIFIITSRMGSVEDNSSGGYYGYRMSKAAVNMAGKSLSVDLAGEGIGVVLLHPGMVATDMTGRQGISVEESGHGLLATMDRLKPEQSGTFWHQDGQALPW